MAKRKVRRYSPAIERNLFATFYRANSNDIEQGLNWYDTAHNVAQRIADAYDVTLETACGVIAVLSPGSNWDKNVADAELFISYYVAGNRGHKLPTVGTYGKRNRNKAIEILEGSKPLDVLGGPKVRSFYQNILDPNNSDVVTIDRHAKCCAYGVKNAENSLVKLSEYEYISRHFRTAASKVNLPVCKFQAVVWVVWRRLNGDLDTVDVAA